MLQKVFAITQVISNIGTYYYITFPWTMPKWVFNVLLWVNDLWQMVHSNCGATPHSKRWCCLKFPLYLYPLPQAWHTNAFCPESCLLRIFINCCLWITILSSWRISNSWPKSTIIIIVKRKTNVINSIIQFEYYWMICQLCIRLISPYICKSI